MIATICPHCNAGLSTRELTDGWCDRCGKKLPSSVTAAAPRRPKTHHHHPASERDAGFEALPVVASLLFLLFLVSILIPHGMFSSLLLAWSKGGTVCAYPGCTEPAVADMKQGDVVRSYCAAHQKEASSAGPSRQLPVAIGLSVVGLLFVGFYAYRFNKVLGGSEAAGATRRTGSLTWFVLLSLAGIVGINGLFWYAARYWC
jgi:hypothetical protein